MSLHTIYVTEKDLQVKKIYARYIDEIMKSYKIFDVTMTSLRNKMHQEKEELFNCYVDPKTGNHFVHNFCSNMFDTSEIMMDTFDLYYQDAKIHACDSYKGHDYYPKVELFFTQSDEDIIKKVALHDAYKVLIKLMFETNKEEIRSAFEIKRCGKYSHDQILIINDIISSQLSILDNEYKNRKIIKDDDLKEVIANCQLLITDQEIALAKTRSIETNGIKPYIIRGVFYELYVSLKLICSDNPKLRSNFIAFIRGSFKAMESEKSVTTESKFSDSTMLSQFLKFKKELLKNHCE
jgi:hypothetical protein